MNKLKRPPWTDDVKLVCAAGFITGFATIFGLIELLQWVGFYYG